MRLAPMIFLLPWVSFLFAAGAHADVRVVATTGSLGALVRDVGGTHVTVDVLARPNQDPHFVDARPSYVLKLNRADLLVLVGLELEVGWLPGLLTHARNADIQPGRAGYLDTSTVAGPLLGAKAGVDRRMGDVHPGGNPHFLYDPRYAIRVAAAIAERLARLDGAHGEDYRKNAARVRARLEKRITAWERGLAPHRGDKVVGFHKSLPYLAKWLGLEVVGHIEPFPGISPSPRHLAKLIVHMRREKAAVVFTEAWYDAETARVVAERAGAKLVRLPGDVGAPGLGSYEALIEHIVRKLAASFRSG